MNIELFTFNKRENSTKRPAVPGAVYNCVLKKDTSVTSPEILIDFSDQDAPQPHLYNYAYIPDFGRYYFVADQRCIHGLLWVYSLTCDIMATYKTDITASTLYLTRCSTQFDGDIVDTYYPVQTSYTDGAVLGGSPWIAPAGTGEVSISAGCFILGIVSQGTGANLNGYGSIHFYAMTRANLLTLVSKLLDDQFLELDVGLDPNEITMPLQKAIIDPLSFIKSCMWAPVDYASISGTEQQNLSVWDWTVPAAAKEITENPPYIISNTTLVIDKHPQAATRGGYLNLSPYTEYSLSIPPFGIIDLDTAKLANKDRIYIQYVYDLITGMCTANVYALTGQTLANDSMLLTRLKAQVGVQIQLSQITKDFIQGAANTFGGVLGALGNLMTGNIGGAIQSGISAIGSAANARKPMQSSMGSSGGFSDLRGYSTLYHIFYDPAPEDLDHVGRPLCQNVAMASLASGSYCIAMDGDVSIAGTAGEQQSLKAYLEGGFYYE